MKRGPPVWPNIVNSIIIINNIMDFLNSSKHVKKDKTATTIGKFNIGFEKSRWV